MCTTNGSFLTNAGTSWGRALMEALGGSSLQCCAAGMETGGCSESSNNKQQNTPVNSVNPAHPGVARGARL